MTQRTPGEPPSPERVINNNQELTNHSRQLNNVSAQFITRANCARKSAPFETAFLLSRFISLSGRRVNEASQGERCQG
jgi:hypothetical protein